MALEKSIIARNKVDPNHLNCVAGLNLHFRSALFERERQHRVIYIYRGKLSMILHTPDVWFEVRLRSKFCRLRSIWGNTTIKMSWKTLVARPGYDVAIVKFPLHSMYGRPPNRKRFEVGLPSIPLSLVPCFPLAHGAFPT